MLKQLGLARGHFLPNPQVGVALLAFRRHPLVELLVTVLGKERRREGPHTPKNKMLYKFLG